MRSVWHLAARFCFFLSFVLQMRPLCKCRTLCRCVPCVSVGRCIHCANLGAHFQLLASGSLCIHTQHSSSLCLIAEGSVYGFRNSLICRLLMYRWCVVGVGVFVLRNTGGVLRHAAQVFAPMLCPPSSVLPACPPCRPLSPPVNTPSTLHDGVA